MKQLIFSPFWFFWKKVVGKYRLTEKDGTAIVIIGFERSGTSLLGQLLAKSGVYFGETDSMKKSDFRNPKGFYEHNDIFNLSRKFLKESGFRDDMPDSSKNFRAEGFLNKIKRINTRSGMLRTLKSISNGRSVWGFKNFPSFFYFWKGYLSRYKLVGIYRNPSSVGVSCTRAWPAGMYTFDQIINFWTKANKDLLYHMLFTNSILICYEDLLDPNKSDRILAKLVDFLGMGSVSDIKGIVTSELNRSSGLTEAIDATYPYSIETKNTLAALESLKA